MKKSNCLYLEKGEALENKLNRNRHLCFFLEITRETHTQAPTHPPTHTPPPPQTTPHPHTYHTCTHKHSNNKQTTHKTTNLLYPSFRRIIIIAEKILVNVNEEDVDGFHTFLQLNSPKICFACPCLWFPLLGAGNLFLDIIAFRNLNYKICFH